MNILVPIGIETDLTVYHEVPQLLKLKKNMIFTLYHVVEIPFITTLEAVDELIKTKRYVDGKRKVEEAKKIFESLGLTAKEKVEFGRDTVEMIINEAISGGYDLIILVKRRKQPRFLGKSVSRAVVARVKLPILILSME